MPDESGRPPPGEPTTGTVTTAGALPGPPAPSAVPDPVAGLEEQVQTLEARAEERVELDDLNTTFKRRVALAVGVLALVGGLLVFLASDAANLAGVNQGRAKEQVVAALALENAAAVSTYSDLSGYLEVSTLKRRADLATLQAELLGTPVDPVTVAQWTAASARLTSVSPLLPPGQLSGRADLLLSQRHETSTQSTLSQSAAQETADSWGQRADSYAGAATMIGVAGTLLGLALTVPPGSRRLLVVASAVIVAGTLVFASVVALRPVRTTPERALQLVAAGDRLADSLDFAGAAASYAKAIALDDDFSTAYTRHSLAVVAAASPEATKPISVITTTSEEARQASIKDLETALALQPDDFVALVNQGANYFHVQDYDKTVTLSRQATRLNDRLPLPWLNLGLGLAAQGLERQADEAYDQAIARIRLRPYPQERGELFAAARGTLATAAVLSPDRAAIVARLQARITEAEQADVLPKAKGAPAATVSGLALVSTGSGLRANFTYAALPPGSRLAWIVYYRGDGATEWSQRPDLSFFESTTLATSGSATKQLFDLNCPTGGDYRLELFTDGRRLGSVTAHQGAGDPKAQAGAAPVLASRTELAGGIFACAPPSWQHTSATTGTMDLTAPGGSTELQVRTLPLVSPPDSEQGRTALAQQVVDRLASTPGGGVTSEFRSGGVGGTPGVYRVVSVKGSIFLVWASVGADGWLRTVSTSAPEKDQVTVDNLLGRVAFR